MTKGIVQRLRQGQQAPLIAIIGATAPTPEYHSRLGIEIGYLLRKHIEDREGTLLTGGVDGVGVHAYIGIRRYCTEELLDPQSNGQMPADRFFILVPETEYVPIRDLFSDASTYGTVPYVPPSVYTTLGAYSSQGAIEVVTAGRDMAERRQLLASVADVLVVVNGGYGTFDEAALATKNQKPVITLPFSGGVAFTLQSIKEGARRLDDKIDSSKIDARLIIIAHDTADMLHKLDSLV